MKIEVVQFFNEKYYEEAYNEWLNYRSKYKKWEHIIGYLSLGLSLILYLVNPKFLPISGGLLVFGTLMIYDFYHTKKLWLNARLDSKINNQQAEIIFEDDKVQFFGPFTQVSGNWAYFRNAIETEKGLILIPENGISIYLQKKIFSNLSDIKLIIQKVIEANTNIENKVLAKERVKNKL